MLRWLFKLPGYIGVPIVFLIAFVVVPILLSFIYFIFDKKLRSKLWTKIKSGFKAFKSAFSAVLLVLLSVLSSLFFSSPASAATAWTSCESTVRLYRNGSSALPDGTINLKQFYATGSYQGISTDWRISFDNCSWTNQYSTHQHFYAAFSVVFSVSDINNYGYVWSSGLNARDNQNYWSVETDDVSSVSYQSGGSNYVVFNHLIQGSVQPNQTISFDFNGVVMGVNKTQASYDIGYMISDLRVSFSEDIDQNILRQLQNQSSDIASIKTFVEQIKNNSSVAGVVQEQQETNDKLDREWQQEQQDRQDYQDAVDDSETGAQDAGADVDSASSTIVGNITSIVNAIINSPSTDCMLSVHTGASGVLQLNNMNLCSAPPEVLNLIHVISGIVVTLAVLWTAYNLFGAVMGIFETIQGGKLNG